MATSEALRNQWRAMRSDMASREKEQPNRSIDWSLLKGLPRASMLTLGYAVEMFLKAGLAKAYIGCSETMFSRDVKRLGHNYKKLAKCVAFPSVEGDNARFKKLQNFVLADARYPVFTSDNSNVVDEINKQTSEIWSEDNYSALRSLVLRVKEHSGSIDQDSTCPAHFMTYNLDKDGYIAVRLGGKLPPRITFQRSTEMRRSSMDDVSFLQSLFSGSSLNEVLIAKNWDDMTILEDTEEKTVTIKNPQNGA